MSLLPLRVSVGLGEQTNGNFKFGRVVQLRVRNIQIEPETWRPEYSIIVSRGKPGVTAYAPPSFMVKHPCTRPMRVRLCASVSKLRPVSAQRKKSVHEARLRAATLATPIQLRSSANYRRHHMPTGRTHLQRAK